MSVKQLIIASVATRSVFRKFAKLSDEEKKDVIEKVKSKMNVKDNGDAEGEEEPAEGEQPAEGQSIEEDDSEEKDTEEKDTEESGTGFGEEPADSEEDDDDDEEEDDEEDDDDSDGKPVEEGVEPTEGEPVEEGVEPTEEPAEGEEPGESQLIEDGQPAEIEPLSEDGQPGGEQPEEGEQPVEEGMPGEEQPEDSGNGVLPEVTEDKKGQMEGIVNDLVQEIKTIKQDGQVRTGDVLGLIMNMMEMVNLLVQVKPPMKRRKSKRGSIEREFLVAGRIAKSLGA